MGIIGLVQWILQFFGILFYLTQYNSMHRINGFSYEPSYYASYMLIGWIIYAYLYEKGNYINIKKKVFIYICGYHFSNGFIDISYGLVNDGLLGIF